MHARIEVLMRVRDALDARVDACPGKGDVAARAIPGVIEGPGTDREPSGHPAS